MATSSKPTDCVKGLRVRLASPKKYSLMAASRVNFIKSLSRSATPSDLSKGISVITSPCAVLSFSNRRCNSACTPGEPRTTTIFTANSQPRDPSPTPTQSQNQPANSFTA